MYDSTMYFGDPAEQSQYWQLQEANDSCAVVAEMTLLNQFGINLNQQEAMYISASHGWYQPGAGTSTYDIGNMMDLYGVPNHTVHHANIADLASELRQGHGVIVSIRSDQLWDQGPEMEFWNFFKASFGLDTPEFSPADHAVVVTGIDVTDPSNPMVILNDSGTPDGQAKAYPLDKFMDAWENSNFYYTATDTPLPHGMDGVSNLQYWERFFKTYTEKETVAFDHTGASVHFVEEFLANPHNIASL